MTGDSTRTLETLSKITGWSCAAIGAGHLLFGTNATVRGAQANATTDSLERFLGAVFGAYGLAWLRAARQEPVAVNDVRALSATMAVGGAGRLLSLAHRGRPHWFQLVLAGVEFVVPAVFEALVRDVEGVRAA